MSSGMEFRILQEFKLSLLYVIIRAAYEEEETMANLATLKVPSEVVFGRGRRRRWASRPGGSARGGCCCWAVGGGACGAHRAGGAGAASGGVQRGDLPGRRGGAVGGERGGAASRRRAMPGPSWSSGWAAAARWIRPRRWRCCCAIRARWRTIWAQTWCRGRACRRSACRRRRGRSGDHAQRAVLCAAAARQGGHRQRAYHPHSGAAWTQS